MPYYRRNLYILSTTIFLAAVSWTQIMPFLPLFMKEMGVKHNLLQWVGVVFAAQSVASIISMPFWGRLGDRYGQKPMVLRAGFCLAGIYIGMSMCHTPLQLVIFRFLNGALTGFIPGSMALIATNTPQEHAPKAMATAQSASAAGQIAGPVIGAALAAVAGYRGSMQLSGIAVLLSTIAVWRLVEEPNKVRLAHQTSMLQDFAVSLRSRMLSSIMLTLLLTGVFVTAIITILTLHIAKISEGAPDWLTGVVFSLHPIAFVLTAHQWARIGERRGYFKAIQAGMIGAAIGALILTTIKDIWAFSAIYFIVGVFLAAVAPAAGAIICTQVKETFRGRAYGMQMSAGMLGGMIAPLMASNLGAAYGIPSVFAFVGAVLLAGSFALPFLVKGRRDQADDEELLMESIHYGGKR